MKVGDFAPDFTLLSSDGKSINLYSQLEERSVVLFFYLKAFTPVCVSEVCNFRNRIGSFTEQGAAVLGVSSDSLRVTQRFRNQYRLPFPLLIDAGGRIRALYNVPNVFNLIPGRSTYVIAADRKIANITHSQLSSQAHIDESLRSLRIFG